MVVLKTSMYALYPQELKFAIQMQNGAIILDKILKEIFKLRSSIALLQLYSVQLTYHNFRPPKEKVSRPTTQGGIVCLFLCTCVSNDMAFFVYLFVRASNLPTIEMYEKKKKHRQLKTVICGRCRLLSHGHMITAVGGHGGYAGGKQFVTAEELRDKLSHLRHEKALIVKLLVTNPSREFQLRGMRWICFFRVLIWPHGSEKRWVGAYDKTLSTNSGFCYLPGYHGGYSSSGIVLGSMRRLI
ncbi:uncharacterized protein [Spinacia oleracea]|uniref:Uncharacterized protein isoform X3 n=2 Tax=Spinacia oleracea TaxID=3562 RepID=A0A9R0JK42_SPIOL|nr:uncharacterized protein LOC110776999 isoform X3 [Spinacia oleracea]